MKRALILPVATVAFFVIGCKSPQAEADLTRISIGMSKEQVIQAIGKPTRVAVQGPFEYLEYEAFDTQVTAWSWADKTNIRAMYVRLVNGRVESFGKKGDFDSTKNPATDLNVNHKIESKVTTTGSGVSTQPFDLKTELEKLDSMKKGGLLSEAEYQQLRQRAIDKAKAQ